jgi:predicted DNA-binding ribbon-helix-helix protein
MSQRHQSASPVKKRSIVISNHKTSLTLEDGFWLSLKEIAEHEELPVAQLVARIDRDRQHANLSSAIRLHVLNHYRRRASDASPGGKAKR